MAWLQPQRRQAEELTVQCGSEGQGNSCPSSSQAREVPLHLQESWLLFFYSGLHLIE